jgi:hypothetical protein
MGIRTPFIFTLLVSSLTVFGQTSINVQDKDAAYIKTITSRSEKIVATLGISDPSKANQITTIIAGQYSNLNSVYTERDEQIKIIKQKGLLKEAMDAEIKNAEASAAKKIEPLHVAFLSALSSKLSGEQVTKVKDGMTYNVVHVTYDAFVDMIPSLTKAQKDQIMAWLVEAREHAMDAESSEKKHWWFGKYKGRINNYLSAQGYDLQKERKEWEERNKQKNKNQN